jgi:DUF4097 and DUF4098 domain-containing protein YvlB
MIRISCLAALASLAVSVVPLAAQDRAPAATPQPQAPIQARPGGPEGSPKTDQTVDVVKGTRLVLSNNAGEVVVRSWDRDQVRVQATHSDRERVEVQTENMTLRVRTRATRGPSNLADYQITVPRWMPVNLSGTYLESTIEGTTAEVTVETVHGNVRVVGGTGAVVARSVEGTIFIDKASGKVQATTVNEGIRLTNVSGDMTAETTNGDIVIENAQTSSLDVSTVNGDVTYNGTMRDGGAYRLTTHGGDIRVGLGGSPNATIFVRTFQGDFTADFPIQLPEGQTPRSGSKRFNFTLGSGAARVELQSFNGDILVARRTIVSPEDARRIRRGQPPQPPQPPPPKPPKDKGFVYNFDRWDVNIEHDWDNDVRHEFNFPHDVEFDFDFDLPHPLPEPYLLPMPYPVPTPHPAPDPPMPDVMLMAPPLPPLPPVAPLPPPLPRAPRPPAGR